MVETNASRSGSEHLGDLNFPARVECDGCDGIFFCFHSERLFAGFASFAKNGMKRVKNEKKLKIVKKSYIMSDISRTK